MIGKLFKFVCIAITCLLLVVVSSALLLRKYLQHRTAAEHAITSPHGIDSLDSVPIGGIKQWIQVRGQNLNNPILLFIHGGPGVAFIPLAGSFQTPWESDFTVVQWDQRGAGKTYSTNKMNVQRRTMNVPQMEQDTLDVANYLRARFHRKKILVLGHSWGSVLGLWLAHEHPELMAAYVGVGQVIDVPENDTTAYHDALQEARRGGNEGAIKDLESLAPYSPQSADQGEQQVARRWEEELLGPRPNRPAFTNTKRLLTDLVSAPEYSLADDFNFIHGQSLSLGIFLPQLANLDLKQFGFDFQEPMFFFEGRQDPYCRPSLVWDYSQSIKAPQKGFIWFDSSGHFPFFDEKQKFRDELVQRILPLAH